MELGINLPWFHGAYGHDLGRNQAYPDWPAAFDPERIDCLLDELGRFGVRLLRIWLFEQGEGVLYDADRQIVGLDPLFMRNIERLSTMLEARGIAVYWTLLDGNSAYRNSDLITFSILTDARIAETFVQRAVAPILPILARTAWAIDICNEPEGVVSGPFGNGTNQGVQWPQVIPSLSVILSGVRSRAEAIRVSLGSGFTEQVNLRDNVEFYSFCLALDFLDYHTYKAGRQVVPRSSCLNPATREMTVVLGEVGCQVSPDQRGTRTGWLRGQQDISAKLHRLAGLGYAAAFVWFVSEPANVDATALYFRHEPGRALHTLEKLNGAGRGERWRDVAT